MQYMYQVRNTIAIDEEYHYNVAILNITNMLRETRKIMQYVYQVRNTIAIDEEYYYRVTIKMSQVCQVKRENYAVYVSSEECHYY